MGAFEDGYMAAIRAELNTDAAFNEETLAAIIADCESKVAGALDIPNAYEGRRFWERRQAGQDVYFPPLRASLDDNGKVRLTLAGEG